jgi:hypothetical protein
MPVIRPSAFAAPVDSPFGPVGDDSAPTPETLARLGLVHPLDRFDGPGVHTAADPFADPADTQVPAPRNGTLYVRGQGDRARVDFDDIKQGGMGDCYLLASLAACARENPGMIRDAIRENRNAQGRVESYDVRLYARDGHGRLQPQDITVDARQFSQEAAMAGDTSKEGRPELWVLVVEKAYAQLNGGYGEIAHGGWPELATEALTGVEADVRTPASRTFADLRADVKSKRPITVWTDGGSAAANLVGNHAYAVIDARTEHGVGMVKLYNPWGFHQPGTADPRGDGGWITFDQYQRLLVGESMGQPVDGPTLDRDRQLEQNRGRAQLWA